ncbi:MAG: hypothetical protein D6731_06295, partial [Planctomycetota bacterium]
PPDADLATLCRAPPLPGARAEARHDWLSAQAFALRVALATAFPTFVALALCGLLPRGPPRPRGAVALVSAAAVFVAVQGLLKANWNTTDRVHQAPLGVLVAPLAGRGLALVAAVLASRWRLRPARVAGLLTASVLLAGPLPKALKIKKAHLDGERELGTWLRADAGPGPLTVCAVEARAVAWHAGARYVAPPTGPAAQALERLRHDAVDYLVVAERLRPQTSSRCAQKLAALGLSPARPPVARRRGSVRYLWWAFRLGARKR